MDSERIKNFFIFHIEKMILCVVVAVSGFLVYQGLQAPNVREKFDPDRMANEANTVRSNVDEDHNSEIIPDRVPVFDIVAEAQRVKTAVDPVGYAFIPLEPPYVGGKSGARRSDPVLAPPKHLHVQGVLMAMALRSRTGEYPFLQDLEPADPVEVVEKKEIKKKKPRSRGRASMDGMMDEMMDEGMMDEGMMDEMMDEGMMEEFSGGAGGRKLATSKAKGFRPSSTNHPLKPEIKEDPIPSVGWFIAGSAAIPYKELVESYKASLSGATEVYDIRYRDRPKFLNYEVQRADVTDKPVEELVDADWVQRDGMTETVLDAAFLWSGFAPELVPADYRDPVVTMWTPPVMMDDYAWFALNPNIPTIPWKDLQADLGIEEDDVPFDIEKMIGEVEVGGGGENHMVGRDEMGMDGFDDEMMMEGGMFGDGGALMSQQNPPEFKLIRFYDFALDPRKDDNAPKRGRKYVYRVRVAVDDPNFPVSPSLQPQGKTMMPEVYERVSALMAKAAQLGKRKPLAERFTPWSAPSDPVSLPGMQNSYVGPVTAPQTRQYKITGGGTAPYSSDQPKAKLVVDQFDGALRTRVGVSLEASPGTVLSKTLPSVDVVDPITLEVKKTDKEFLVQGGSTVVDIVGGDPIMIHKEETQLLSPGVMLLFDDSGKLKIHDEADDLELYRIRSFADERGE